MPWTTPRTWVTNELVTAAIMNTHVRDNLNMAFNQALVRATHSVAQATVSGTTLALALDTESWDQVGGSASTQHDTVTNNSRLTAQVAGIYLISGNVEWVGNATGRRDLMVRLNGAFILGYDYANPSTGATIEQSIVCMWPFNVGDYVELCVNQTSGGALNVNAALYYSPSFAMVRVGN